MVSYGYARVIENWGGFDMAFALNQSAKEATPRPRWVPMRLYGLPELRLSYHFDHTHHFDHTDTRQTLVLSVRIDPEGWILKYGMSRRDLGSAWDDDKKARRRLKGLAKAELRADLFLFHAMKKVPCSVLRITWLDSKGRTIGSSIFPPFSGEIPTNTCLNC